MLSGLLAVTAVVVATDAPPNPSRPVVDIKGLGKVKGTTTDMFGAPVERFLGMRYARAARFESPVKEKRWKGVREATSWGNVCTGSGPRCVYSAESEDCLFLNVFRKTKQSRKRRGLLPVMVYIYGGSFNSGCSNVYDGSALAAKEAEDVIIVSFNYRVGAFGFLGGEELRGAKGTTGGWGLEDQRLALEWTKRHIRAFGGNPRKITLFGQSAGAASIGAHMTSPLSRGLFRGVIGQSGLGADFGNFPMTVAEATLSGVKAQTGCATVDCLKGLPADVLVQVSQPLQWAPVIDGKNLRNSVIGSFEAGDYDTSVSVVSGITRDESALFLVEQAPFNLDEAAFDNLVRNTPGAPPVTDAALAAIKGLYDESVYEYPAIRGPFSKWWWMAMRIQSDIYFTCPNRRALRALSKHTTRKIYSYFLTHVIRTQTPLPSPLSGPQALFVPHGIDIPVTLGCASPLTGCAFDGAPGEQELVDTINKMWLRTARRRHPSKSWVPYTPSTVNTLQLDVGAGLKMIEHPRESVCDFWDSI